MIMKTRICTKCGEELPAISKFFNKNNKLKGGLHCWCKKCCKDYSIQYRKDNLDNLKKYHKQWCKDHSNELKDYKRLWYQKNQQVILGQKKIYYKTNIDKILEREKKYRQSDRGKEIIKRYQQSEDGMRALKEGNKRYRQSEKGKKKSRLTNKKHYERNKLSKTMSVGIRRALKHEKANRHWEEFVPYTLEQLKKYLENLFQDGMSWDNYGKWHLDHIKPISLFNIISPDCGDFKYCWSLENLQPLWAADNFKKSNKF